MFLNPVMLAGIGGAAVPLVLHLLARARYRTIDWGAMMFLEGASPRQRRSRRIWQWVLLGIRMAIVALLAMALARPVVQGQWAALADEARTTAVIVLDRSASMGQMEGAQSRFDIARQAALQVLARLRSGDQVALLLCGDEGGVTDGRPTGDLRAVASLLTDLKPSFGRADMQAALVQAEAIFARWPEDHHALFVVTDRQALNWPDPQRLAAPGVTGGRRTSHLLTVGGGGSANVSVDGVALVNPPAVKRIAAEVEVQVRNHGRDPVADLPLKLSVAGSERFATTVSLGAGEARAVRAWLEFDRTGPQVLEAQVESPDLAEDNRALAVVEVADPLKVLVVSGDEREGLFRRESDFLSLALNPFGAGEEKGPACATVEVVSPERLGSVALADYAVVVLANVPQVSPNQARALEQYVYDGGGVIVAPGALSRVESYNQLLHRAGTGLLPGELGPPTAPDGTGATGLLGLDLSHPVFRFLRGVPDPVPTATIGRYFPVRPGAQARVLATLATGEPFLAESRLGLGRVLLMSTALDADWGTLPLTGFYLPYVQSLVRYAAGGALPVRNVALGEPLRLVEREAVDEQRSIVIGPDGRRQRPQVSAADGRTEVRFAGTGVPGLYQMRLRIDERTQASPFVVGRPAAESDLTPLSPARLAEIAGALKAVHVDLSTRRLAEVLDAELEHRELWGSFLAAVFGLIALEMIVARWTGSPRPLGRPTIRGWRVRLMTMRPGRRGRELRAAGVGASAHNAQPVGMVALLGAMQWEDLSALPVAVAAGAGLAALVLWLYGPQVRQTGVRWSRVLPVLRLLAVAALAVSILKPATVRPRQGHDGSAIAVLIDRSQSMAIRDSERSPGQLVALADGLGMLPPEVRPPAIAQLMRRLTGLNAQVDAIVRSHAEAEYARLSGGSDGPARQRAERLEEALRREIASIADGAAALSDAQTVADAVTAVSEAIDFATPEAVGQLRQRIEAAIRAARSHQSSIDQALLRQNETVRETMRTLAGRSRLELAELILADEQYGLLGRLPRELTVYGFALGQQVEPLPLHRGGRPVEKLAVEADALRSEIAVAVSRVMEKLRHADLRAIVLLSDGRQVGGEGQVVSSLTGTGVPVFAVLPAPARAARDVVVSRLDVPGSAHVGQTIMVRAEIRGRRIGSSELTVQLRCAGQTQRQQVQLGDNDAVTVEFAVRMVHPGTPEVEVSVEPLEGEATVANNTARRRVKVHSRPLQVGAYAGWGGWDFQYMRNALQRAPGIRLRDGVLHSGLLPISPEQILKLDVLVLSGVHAGAMTAAQRDAVHRLVHQRGGSVIVLAADGQAMRSWQEDVLLSALLPWIAGQEAIWRVWPGASAGFYLTVAPDAADLDALRLGEGQNVWQQLPGVYRLLATPQLRPNVRPLLVERETGLPALTEARVGAGRVLTLLTNESWRWRYRTGERYHERFWRQLVHYAAEPPYLTSTDRMAFDADTLSVEPNQPVHVRARRLMDLEESGELRVRIVKRDTVVDEVAMTPLAAGRYERTLPALPEGDYTLELVDPARPQQVTLWLPLQVAQTVAPELAELSPDEALLRRLAEASGGRVLGLDEVGQLPALIDGVLARRPQTVQETLWDSPYLFALVLGCLSLEWALRKRLGLV